jgi:hypothetical protein
MCGVVPLVTELCIVKYSIQSKDLLLLFYSCKAEEVKVCSNIWLTNSKHFGGMNVVYPHLAKLSRSRRGLTNGRSNYQVRPNAFKIETH